MPSPFRRIVPSLLFMAACLLLPTPTAMAEPGLKADQLLLVVNENVPVGRELASFYAQIRKVPDGRIVALDLPTGDQMPREAFDTRLAGPLREFLEENGLKDQVTCLVTFFGVPLAVGERTLTAEERDERVTIDRLAAQVADRLDPIAAEAEAAVAEIGYDAPDFSAAGENVAELEKVLTRLERARQAAAARLPTLGPDAARTLQRRFEGIQEGLAAPFSPSGSRPSADLQPLLSRQHQPEARQTLRNALAGGRLLDFAQVLRQQLQLLSTEQSDASVDSELSLLWQRSAGAARWLPNPLTTPGAAPGVDTLLMTCRLDSVSPQSVRDLIAESILAERDGLSGSILVDSRGLDPAKAPPKEAAYAQFDQGLRDLVTRLERETDLPVIHDDEPAVFAPPGHRDVAVYVGWYSVTKYVDAFDFNRGAVAYHVASYELRSLRDVSKPGWVRSLLEDGVVATLGPVSEPYLFAFPPPDAFVPALLEGDQTLAEVYWRTLPVTSWKMTLIGDPLYRPFKADAS